MYQANFQPTQHPACWPSKSQQELSVLQFEPYLRLLRPADCCPRLKAKLFASSSNILCSDDRVVGSRSTRSLAANRDRLRLLTNWATSLMANPRPVPQAQFATGPILVQRDIRSRVAIGEQTTVVLLAKNATDKYLWRRRYDDVAASINSGWCSR